MQKTKTKQWTHGKLYDRTQSQSLKKNSFLFSKGGFLFPFCGSETLLLHLACGYWIPPSTVRFLSPPPLSYICVEWKEIKAGRKREGNAVIIGGRPLFFMFKIFFSHKNILTARLKTSRLCVCVCVCLSFIFVSLGVCASVVFGSKRRCSQLPPQVGRISKHPQTRQLPKHNH